MAGEGAEAQAADALVHTVCPRLELLLMPGDSLGLQWEVCVCLDNSVALEPSYRALWFASASACLRACVQVLVPAIMSLRPRFSVATQRAVEELDEEERSAALART